MSNMREMFLANGFDDFLAKPMEIPKLNDIMERWIPQGKREKGEGSAQNLKSAAFPAEREENIEEAAGGPRIKGLDVARGIAMTGGTEEGYMDVLEIFCQDAEERLEKLSEAPDDIGLASFTIQVHALKSASASIGASETSRLAAELESAGKSGQLDFIRENLAAFTENLTELTGRIKRVLDEYANGSHE
jgi:HPt (histidine-containing phosphotransfer) domain-containing protein